MPARLDQVKSVARKSQQSIDCPPTSNAVAVRLAVNVLRRSRHVRQFRQSVAVGDPARPHVLSRAVTDDFVSPLKLPCDAPIAREIVSYNAASQVCVLHDHLAHPIRRQPFHHLKPNITIPFHHTEHRRLVALRTWTADLAASVTRFAADVHLIDFYCPGELRRVHYNTVRPHSSLGYRPPAPRAYSLAIPQPAESRSVASTLI